MQHPGSKSPVLALHTGMQQAHDEIGILQAPAGIRAIESIDMIEVVPRYGEIAGLRASPIGADKLTQRPKRQPQGRQQPIDAAAKSLREQFRKMPGFSRDAFAEHDFRQFA